MLGLDRPFFGPVQAPPTHQPGAACRGALNRAEFLPVRAQTVLKMIPLPPVAPKRVYDFHTLERDVNFKILTLVGVPGGDFWGQGLMT